MIHNPCYRTNGNYLFDHYRNNPDAAYASCFNDPRSRAMKFRKKPVVVDAQQWFPPGDERHDPSMLTLRAGNSVNPPDYRQTGDLYPFTTIKGMGCDNIYFIRVGGVNDNVQVHPGDWIITGIKGEKYPCSDEIFKATYEPA